MASKELQYFLTLGFWVTGGGEKRNYTKKPAQYSWIFRAEIILTFFGCSSPLSFSFQNFFLHGESTVCVSVDVEKRAQLYQLSPQQLKQAKDGYASTPGKKNISYTILSL